MSSELFKLVSEKALENTDTVIAEKVNPVLGALGIAGLTATATIPAVKNIDNIKNYFTQSETNMGKPVKAEQLKTGYGITYIDSKGNKLVKQGGDISKLANNPGNIALPKSGFGPKNKQKFKDLGAIGWFVGKSNVFAVFPDEETGKKALYTWFFSGDRDDWTIKKTMNIYAPVSENNTERYLNFIKNHGISLDSKLSDLSNSQQDILISAIIKMEGKHPVKSEQFIPVEPKLTNNVQKVSVKESLENNVDILTKAKNYFGLTTSISEAGYILPNGTMLDFSGKKFGGSPNRRSMDHREISSAFDSEEITMPDIVELGCIRIDGDLGYVSMAILPTNAQFETLENIMYKKGHIDVECAKNITDWYNNHNLFYKEYNGYNFERVKKDIINYYSNKPLTKLQVFHENNLNNINSKSEKIEMGEKELNRFYKWFGNSKVVDKQNRPLVVYHGTNHIFDKFSKRKSLSNTHMNELGAGFYFSPYIEDAESYGSNILSFYLRIENPFIASKEQLQLLKDYTNLNFEIDNIKEIEDIIDIVNELGIRKFPRILIELGFDGIILYGQYVVFNANQMKAAEYGNDGHYRRSSNNFNESITLNEATGIPTYQDDGEKYFYAYYCFTESELLNLMDSTFKYENIRVAYEFNKKVYLVSGTSTSIHYNIIFLAATETSLFDFIPEIKENKNADEDTIQELIKQYLYIAPFKIYRNDKKISDKEFIKKLFGGYNENIDDGYDMACKLNDTKWAVCRSDEFGDVKQVPLFQGKEWISFKEINAKLPNDEGKLNESSIPMWDDNIEDYITGAFYCFTGNELQSILDNNLHHEDARVIYEFNKGVYLLTESINAIHNQILEMAIINTKLFDSLGDIKQIKEENEGQVTLICEEARKYLDLITFKIFRNMETDTDEQFLEFLVRLPDNWTDDYSEGFACKLNNTTWAICRYNEFNKIKQIPIFNGKKWISLKEINERLSEDEEELNESQEEVKKIIAYHGSQQKRIKFNKDKVLYLTRDYNQAKSYATREWDEGLIEGEIPVIFKFEVSIKKPFITDGSEDSFFDFCDEMMVKEGRKNELISQGYDSIIHNGFIGVFFENQLKLLDTEILPWNPKYYYPEDGGINWEDKEDYYYFDEYDNEDLNESVQNNKVIAYHGSQTDKLQFMKNHALYLTDNYDLAYEFATKDGDGGLIDGEIATLYTCELNLKKVYETHSEAEYDSNFIDISFNREKWLEKGYNAIIIHPTEASPTTYYIMLNPEEDVKITDKEIIDYGDLLNEVIICFKSNNLVEGIHGTVSDRNAKYFIKKAEENGFRFAGWDKGHRSYTTDSLYFKIIGNTIYQCRSSDHSKPDELKANDIDTYITLSEFNPNKIDEIVDDLIRRNSIMNKCIQIYSEKLNDTFIKDYIINSINNTNNNKYLMRNLLKKHNLYSVKVDVQKYIWFKQLLKNKVEEFLEKHPEYQKYYHQIGITEWSEENNYLKNGW